MDEKYKRQLRQFYETRRRMPSYSEIMSLVGFSSRASVFKLISRLANEGFLIKDKRGKLSPGNIWGELRVLGLVEAGFPSPAEEDRGDGMSLDEYLIPQERGNLLRRDRALAALPRCFRVKVCLACPLSGTLHARAARSV
jgi:repressor LexA